MSENEEKSIIYIEFEDIGSVNIVNFAFDNVTAYQLLAMAHLLEFEGKNNLAMERAAQMQQAMAQPQQQILVPKPEMEKWD